MNAGWYRTFEIAIWIGAVLVGMMLIAAYVRYFRKWFRSVRGTESENGEEDRPQPRQKGWGNGRWGPGGDRRGGWWR